MMFTGITISVALVALASGVALLIWSIRNGGKGSNLARIFGYLISIVSFMIIAITLIMGIVESFAMKKMMKEGCPMCKMMQDKNTDEMQNKSMMNNKKMMQENTQKSNP